MVKKEKTSEKLKLDQIMKVLFKLSKKVTINLLNALFDEKFVSNEVTIEYGNSEFIDDDYERIIGDLFINVYTKDHVYRYHIEFQTLNDASMVIRMFRYGFEKAKEISDASEDKEIRLAFPKQLVIFLEENENISDHLSMTLVLPDGQELKYTVPVMQYWKYTPIDLESQKMYALLPLQVFKSRKKITSIYESNRPEEEKAQLINEEFNKLIDTTNTVLNIVKKLHDEKEIPIKDFGRILDVLVNVTSYLYSKYGEYRKIDEEVTIMIKTLYDPAIKEEGIKEGIKEGIRKGRIGKAQENILNAIKAKFDTVPDDFKNKILKIDDEAKLDEVLIEVVKSSSIDEVYKMV
ncbi:MAG: hypothetical protein QME46_11100 [Thermoanaerobacteraceae bacterium]|nr:hypothetical protein [Thermoanaerobacteraceae bacterium]